MEGTILKGSEWFVNNSEILSTDNCSANFDSSLPPSIFLLLLKPPLVGRGLYGNIHKIMILEHVMPIHNLPEYILFAYLFK